MSTKGWSVLFLTVMTASAALADTVKFDREARGMLPAGWNAGVTGPGKPRWVVRADRTAPSRPNVLMQLGEGYYPWCVKRDISTRDGFLEVKFKPVSGDEHQAGGVVWRWKDADTYYVATANALLENVSLSYVEHGIQHALKSVPVPVASNAWHTLRVQYADDRIAVALDGQKYIAVQDNHLTQPGAVGVWTRADSVTAFDDFSYGPDNAF